MSDDLGPDPAARTPHRKPTAPPRMRPRRRATSPGTGAAAADPAVAPAPDDSDVGWGDRTPADQEARYLADRPPHWGSD